MPTTGHDVTQSDVAEAAGVSRSLVSLALSGSPKVAEETRVHIARIASSLGYRVNAAASALARRSRSWSCAPTATKAVRPCSAAASSRARETCSKKALRRLGRTRPMVVERRRARAEAAALTR